MIPSIITGITDFVKTWYQGKLEKQRAQTQLDLAEYQNKARLMLDEQSNNHAWEMANLQDKDKWLRRISFFMFAAPFFVAIFFPEHIKIYFDTALADIPEWWQKTFVAINGAIWGLSSLKNVAPSVLDVFRKK
jgi:hypothetical protein